MQLILQRLKHVITDADLANNSVTVNEIANGAVTHSKLDSGVSLGAGYYIANDGSVNGNANNRTTISC